jgi:GTPase SAR1 family protein
MVKKEQSSKKTEVQRSGDLLAVSSISLSIATSSTEFRRKIVIVGDASCGKKALLM